MRSAARALEGIPTSAKDEDAIAGWPVTASSMLIKDNRATGGRRAARPTGRRAKGRERAIRIYARALQSSVARSSGWALRCGLPIVTHALDPVAATSGSIGRGARRGNGDCAPFALCHPRSSYSEPQTLTHCPANQGAEASRGPPRPSRARRIAVNVTRLPEPPRPSSASSPAALRLRSLGSRCTRAAARRRCESCQETGCHEEYQRMDGTRDRSGRSKSSTPSRRRSRLRP
jgi:hypothetical protein